MSGKKIKSVENNENLCPLTRKRIKPTISSRKPIKDIDTTRSLEEMGVGMLESDESSSSASAIALAVSASDENSNEVTPNLDAPKFCNHTMQQSRRNYSADLDTTDNATFSNETLTTQSYTNTTLNFSSKVNNNNSNSCCSSAEKSTTDTHGGSTEKAHQRKVAILGAGSLSSKKSRSPLSTVACNNNYKNITKSYLQATSTPSSYVPTAQEVTPSSCGPSTSSKVETVTASTSASVTKQFFVPDDNFFLYRNRALRGSDGTDHFGKLSDEILLQIFKLLPKKALLRCSCVCQRFNRCARDESLWSRLDLGGRTLRAGALGDILPRGVVILRLAQSELSHPTLDPELLRMYPDFESKLQFLDLSMAVVTKASLKLLLSRCRQLKKLSLEHLHVNDEICDEIAKNLELEALNLAMVTGLESWSVRKMMIALKNLNSLNISWTNLHVDAVSTLVTNVTPNLMRLNISGCRKTMFDSHLVTLSKRCPQLLELDVSDCTALTSNAVNCVCKFKSLEYLSLSRCYQILAPAYMELGSITTLKYLDLFGILSDNALEMLEHSCPKIGINKFVHSSVARPTVGTRRTSIWGLRTRD